MKNVAGVIVGYIVMMVLVVAFLFGLYAIVGTEGAFQPGSFESSMTWNIASIVLGFIAALGGGWVCAKISGSARASYWLAGLVLVIGFVFAIPAFGAHPQETRPPDLPAMDAMQKAYTPAWIAVLNPIIGALGALITKPKS